MKMRPSALAVMATALIAVGAAPAVAQAAPEPATGTETAASVQASGLQYYGAYSTRSKCRSVAYSIKDQVDWGSFTCKQDYRDGRTVYELWYQKA